jgi:predicted RNA-binding Zn-ribbon protein involved in translation (DUF1610 family)
MNHGIVNDNQNHLLCEDCGETVTTFLREMAEHNAKITCPHCGKVYDHNEAAKLMNAAAQPARESGSH